MCHDIRPCHLTLFDRVSDPRLLCPVQDFLKVDPYDMRFAGVQAILLDPSCSGSGTVNIRMDYSLRQGGADIGAEAIASGSGTTDFPGVIGKSTQRIKFLAAFQTRAVKHALRFPKACRIVYSTCSVYAEENEEVIAAAMPHATAAGWCLARALPHWQRRGLKSYSWADRVARVHPDLDGGDGFFVAVFHRNTGNEPKAV